MCLLATASGDSAEYTVRFYAAYRSTDCEPSHLSLFGRTVDDLGAYLNAQDVIYVGGGNTVNMLAIWRAHGVDAALRQAYAAGTVLCGVSAGCICWFEAGITDSFGPGLHPLRDGLAILAGSACPHYDSEELRRPVFARAVAGGFPPGIALGDGVAAHFVDERLAVVVSARAGACAFYVDEGGEKGLEVRPLG